MKYVVTGSNGYVGSQIKFYLEGRGHEVKEMRRSAMSGAHIPFVLGELIDSTLLNGAEVLVHCAYDFKPRSWSELKRVNVDGTRKLFEAAKAAQIQRIIFISSVSAYKECKSLYGRAKYDGEEIAKEFNAVIIRPGLVYGETPGGMVGKLRKSVRGPFVPVVGGSQNMFLVHDLDLAKVVEASSVPGPIEPGRPFVAANPTPVKFKDILKSLAVEAGSHPKFVPVPWQGIWFALKAIETLGVPLSMRSDSLVSLMNPNPSLPFEVTTEFGLHFAPFNV